MYWPESVTPLDLVPESPDATKYAEAVIPDPNDLAMESLLRIDQASNSEELGERIRDLQLRRLDKINSLVDSEINAPDSDDYLLSIMDPEDVIHLIFSAHRRGLSPEAREVAFRAALIQNASNKRRVAEQDPSIIELRSKVDESFRDDLSGIYPEAG